MGLTGYFRHFVKNYALLTEPLTRLTRKRQPFQWNNEQTRAFENLKECLTSRPVLKIYEPEAKTEVHTDASSLGLGGIALQQHESKLHPIAYYSRQTTPAERN